MRKMLFYFAATMAISVTPLQSTEVPGGPRTEEKRDERVAVSEEAETFVPLSTSEDAGLTAQLWSKMEKNPVWRNLIEEKKLAVSLVDMQEPEAPRFASVNGDNMMYAASLPKIAILLSAEDALEKGELEVTPEVRNDMRIMISQSNNGAASRMIDRVGGFNKIAEVLTDPAIRLYDEQDGGGLWVGKHYGACTQRKPDPIKGLSHAATSDQVARFYYLLAKGRLINAERSRDMLDILKDPELHHKFVNTLDRIAPGATVYRKSGTWRTYHADSALVVDGGWRNYILVALIDDPQGEMICRQLVEIAEALLRPRA